MGDYRVTCWVILSFFISFGAVYAEQKIPARHVIAIDRNGGEKNLQDILDKILPKNDSVDLSDLTASAAELNVLVGISANVTAVNLNRLTGGGETGLHSHSGGGSTTTLDGAYDNDTSGNAQVTIDARDVSFDLNDATNDYKFQIDNTTTGAIADALFFNTTGVGGTFTDAIDASDGGITNAINIGANTIVGTTGIINFTDFDVDADGLVTLAPDGGGTGITITPSAALTTGLDASNSNITNGVSLGATTLLGTTAVIDFTDFDVDADGLVTLAPDGGGTAGLTITHGTVAPTSGILINPSVATTANGILVLPSAGVAITDGIDVSDDDIVNAVNMGDNVFIGTTATIDFTDFDVDADGLVTLAPDGGGTSITVTPSAALTTGLDVSNSNITNGVSLGATTLLGTTTVVDFTDFDVSADGTVILGTDTAGATAVFDINHSAITGTQDDGILIRTSGATLTDAIDVSDSDITNAINLGANAITGTNFKFDGVGQLTLGAGGGGGGGTGTGILTFKGGGTIDSTSDGDIVIAPQDAGLVDFPNGTTVRLPQASPAENRDGLYWDEVNSKLCIDRATDICTAALTLTVAANVTSEEMEEKEQKEALAVLFKNEKGVKKLNELLVDFVKMNHPQQGRNDAGSQVSIFDDSAIEEVSSIFVKEGYLYSIFEDAKHEERVQFIETSSQPYIFDRDSGKLVDGKIFIPLNPTFLELAEIESIHPHYRVQVTPTSMDVKGPLVVQKGSLGFYVIDVGGKTKATFDWEVAALKKREDLHTKYPTRFEFEKKFVSHAKY